MPFMDLGVAGLRVARCRVFVSGRLRLCRIASAALVIVPVFYGGSAGAQSHSLGSAVPAAPSKYDFRWRKYTATLALGGRVFHIFDGPQPVGIASLGADGRIDLYPLVSGKPAEELRAAFEGYKKARGVGATSLLGRSAADTKASSPRPAGWRGETPTIRFDASGSHVSLIDGVSVDFQGDGIDLTMPAAVPDLPATKVCFGPIVGAGETRITLNGNPIAWQRRGPIWESLKGLVLRLALSRAAQAAKLAADAPGRPAVARDYVALVADIQRQVN